MDEEVRFTTRKGDTLEPGTPSQALSGRNTANARIMAETIRNSPAGIQSGFLKIWPTAPCFILKNPKVHEMQAQLLMQGCSAEIVFNEFSEDKD